MPRRRWPLAALLPLILSGCAGDLAMRRIETVTAKDPGTPHRPAAARAPAPAPAPPAIPEELARPGATVTLPQVISLALQANPTTRIAWARARAAAANLGVERGAYFPAVDASLTLSRQRLAALGGERIIQQTTFSPSLAITWLLFDLGGRAGDVEAALHALEAADLSHDAAIQTVVLRVTEAYYGYQNAKAQAAAAQATLRAAEIDAEAAEERHRAGVATIADVLQAKTALSQAKLAFETASGAVHTIRGALATALGLPATLPVETAELPQVEVDSARVAIEAIEVIIARAEERRPDLLAARAGAARAAARVRSARAAGLPSLVGSAAAGRTYYPAYPEGASAAFSESWSGTLSLKAPIFSGLSAVYDTIRAQEEARAAAEEAESLRQQVVLQVYTSTYDVKTSAQRVLTTRDLLASATQSEDVARERYKAGVGSILDLLTAESALASARALEAQARADWLVSLARLAHATGALFPAFPAPAKETK